MDDTISRRMAIEKFETWLKVDGYSEGELNMLKAVLYELRFLPSAYPEVVKDTNVPTNDCISRQAAIRWVKTECNLYGNPTLDFESGKKVIKHLEQMPPTQPEILACGEGELNVLDTNVADCSDCIKHGGDWDCDHVHCHKGESAQPERMR